MKVEKIEFSGFDFDSGNIEKVQKYGVTIEMIRECLEGEVLRLVDYTHSRLEDRNLVIGELNNGRPIFLVYTLRFKSGLTFLRPISARFMHKGERIKYEDIKNKIIKA